MRPSHIRVFILVLVSLAFLGWAIPTAANFVIEYNWWKEVAQVNTWISMLWYSIAPTAVGALLAFIALYVAHTRGLHFAGIRQRDYPFYSRLVPVGLAVIALLFASSSIDFWTVMRFFGSRGLSAPPDAWQDKVFSHALPFDQLPSPGRDPEQHGTQNCQHKHKSQQVRVERQIEQVEGQGVRKNMVLPRVRRRRQTTRPEEAHHGPEVNRRRREQ